MTQKPFNMISGVIFSAVALLHALRVAFNLLLVVLLLVSGNLYAQDITSEYSGLFDCAEKMQRQNPMPSYERQEYSLVVFGDTLKDDDMMYVLGRKSKTFYILTPHFKGKTDLSVDEHDNKIEGAESYNVRIPYNPADESKMKGYYYLTLYHPNNRYFAVGNPSTGRFLPGAAQEIPDFESQHHAIHATGVLNSGVKYYSLEFEDRIWRQKTPPEALPELNDILIADIFLRTKSMINPRTQVMEPALTKTPQGSGHAGEGWIPSDEMIAFNNNLRQDAINSCKAVADKYHLKLFQE